MFLFLALSKSFLFLLCIWCLFTTQFSLVLLDQISSACSESWYRKLEFCVTSFWFYYHLVLLSFDEAAVALFLLYVFLVGIFSWRHLFQVTRTDDSCVFYIICSQFIIFEQATLYAAYCNWFSALLASPYAVLLSICPNLFLAQFDSSVYIRIQLLRTVIMSFHRWLFLLLRLKVTASI